MTDNAWSAQAIAKLVTGGRTRNAALESGLVTENDLGEMAKAWEHWEERDQATLGKMHGEILFQNSREGYARLEARLGLQSRSLNTELPCVLKAAQVLATDCVP